MEWFIIYSCWFILKKHGMYLTLHVFTLNVKTKSAVCFQLRISFTFFQSIIQLKFYILF